MTQHTPGPWQAGNSIGAAKSEMVTTKAENGSANLIASLEFSCYRDAQEDNARLIAAAPELLAALQAIQSCWYRNPVGNGLTKCSPNDDDCSRVDAAIKKATQA